MPAWAAALEPAEALEAHLRAWRVPILGRIHRGKLLLDVRTLLPGDEAEIAAKPGREMVNASHPQVIEIWNLVFMQFNRKANGTLEELPARNVDTGMGFERLCMILQGKKSNYDTDVFQPTIGRIAEMSGKKYGEDRKADVAMRVIADHLRAIAFSIADGQLPSNVKAGYVIRRILRRAVRYGYTYLGFTEPTLCRLVPGLVGQMGGQFPELKAQQGLIEKVIEEEESSFLRTLATGITLLDGDEVVGMQICTQGDYLLVVSENGKGKRTPMAEFTVQLRGGKGVKSYKITEKTGNLIGSKAVNEDNEIMMITTEGIIIRTPCSGISVMGRITSGVKLMDVDGEIKVASIAKVRDKEASEETSVSEKENETASEKTQE